MVHDKIRHHYGIAPRFTSHRKNEAANLHHCLYESNTEILPFTPGIQEEITYSLNSG